MSIRRTLVASATATLVAIALAACGTSGSSDQAGGGTTTTAAPTSSGTVAPTGGSSTASSSAPATDTIASHLVLGGPPEFKTRPDGVPGLKRVYGVVFGGYKALDAGGPLTINALVNGQIDAGDVFTTDPSIKADKFVVLKDPKSLYAAQNVLPLINKSKATAGVAKVLNAVSAKLTTQDLINFNVAVVTNKQDPAAVAKAWLAAKGLDTKRSLANGTSIKVGSANFQENVTLAELYAEALADNGASVTTKLNIGSRETYYPGLKDGSIDLVPEYSGVLLQYVDQNADETTSAAVYKALKKALPSSLTVLNQSAAQDKDSIAVTAATAQKYHLSSIGDLAKAAS